MTRVEKKMDRWARRHVKAKPQPERLYHRECGRLVKKEFWFEPGQLAICISCDRQVSENDLLTYDQWKGLCGKD